MNKKYLMYGGGALLLILAYMYYRSQSAGSGSTSDTLGTPSDQEAADYAGLAGDLQQQGAQEASDVSSLQGQMQQLADTIAGLTGGTTSTDDSGTAAPPETVTDPVTGKTKKKAHHAKKATHKKAGHKHTHRHHDAHTNHHHPAGHAGHAVAPRSHAPKRAARPHREGELTQQHPHVEPKTHKRRQRRHRR